MSDTNVAFCRLLLTQLVAEFKTEFPHIRVTKHGWVICAGFRGHWEFHAEGPAGKYYWNGHADNAYEARYKGWSAWAEREREADARATVAGFVIKPCGQTFELYKRVRKDLKLFSMYDCKGDAADAATEQMLAGRRVAERQVKHWKKNP